MAKYEFKLPDIGEGTAEGEIVKWHVKVGDKVKDDDPMVEVMTDKATVVIPSPKDGTITKLYYKEGEIAPVHTVIVEMELDGSEFPANGKTPSKAHEAEAQMELDHFAPEAKASVKKTETPIAAKAVTVDSNREILSTPATRKLARDLNVDISLVPGTGKGGRITDEDVNNFGSGKVLTTSQRISSYTHKAGGIEEIPFTGIRRKIADKMAQSKYTAPHFTYMDEIDMTAVVELREKLKPAAEKEGIKLTYMPFILKALVEALKRNPKLNATLNVEKNMIERRFYYNIGIGMDTATGLIVPVLKNVDQKSIFEIAKELKELGDRTKSGQVKADELKDGTFTISNVGAIGGLMATPIINFPEVAIVAPGKISQRPMVVDGKIEIRHMMYHSWSCDHRIVDGADAVRCGNDFAKFLSQPELLLVNLR